MPKHRESNAYYVAGAAVVAEVVLILDFLICVILRTLDTKSTLMHKDDLTKEDELLRAVANGAIVDYSADQRCDASGNTAVQPLAEATGNGDTS